MVSKPKSDNVKSRIEEEKKAARIEEAVKEYWLYQEPGRSKKSVRSLADAHGVSRTTLQKRIDGRQSILDFNAGKQLLKPAIEKVLVDFILESADHGFPMPRREIEALANASLETERGLGCETVGSSWYFNFLDRHHERLQTHWSKPLDSQRASSLNPVAVKSWFDIVEKYVVLLGIPPELIYGMDESGFPSANTKKERVVGARGTKTQHSQGGADRENVTAIITICADGSTVKPLIIFKGKNMMKKWNNDNVAGAYITHSENGWTDGKIGRAWLEDVFDTETSEKAAGRTRILIVDGHSSHYSLEFIRYAQAHNMTVLGYPPHCTHALQGLDVVCFGKMKTTWHTVIDDFEQRHRRPVGKADFTGLFGKAYLLAFDPETVKAAFRATGVYPFNRDVITAAQMKPSIPHSTKGSFPLTQPSPVRAIMAAFNTNPPTTLDTSPSNRDLAHLGSPIAGPSYRRPRPTTPDSPTRRRVPQQSPHSSIRQRDPTYDLTLYTPTSRMRSLYSNLGSTSSGSFLVSKVNITSSTPIIPPNFEAPPSLPQPDWSLATSPTRRLTFDEMLVENKKLRENLHDAEVHVSARDAIIEGSHAQMTLQNLHLQKVNAALNNKENKKKNDRSQLFDGQGTILSAPEFEAKLVEAETRRTSALTQKSANAAARVDAKAARQRIESEWEEIKAAHAVNLQAWEAKCQLQTESGVRKKDLQKKPKCPPKPKMPAARAASVSSDEEDEGDDEGE